MVDRTSQNSRLESWEKLVSAWEGQSFHKSLDSATLVDDIEAYSSYISPIGEHFTYLFDCSQSRYIYISDACMRVTGFDKQEWLTRKEPSILDELVYPDDQQALQELGKQSWDFYHSLAIGAKKKLCCCLDYRAVHQTNREIIRLVEFNRPLLIDDNGSMLLNFGVVTDISHLKIDGPVGLKVWVEGLPQLSITRNATNLDSQSPLTKTEKLILARIAEGNSTHDVAAELFISTHTVNTHRKNILRKLGCGSVIEGIHIARLKGWIV